MKKTWATIDEKLNRKKDSTDFSENFYIKRGR